jgi:hypothetical protein
MATTLEGCPYVAATRAERCPKCIIDSGGVPPCAIAWLRIRMAETRTPVCMVEHRLARAAKAAACQAA